MQMSSDFFIDLYTPADSVQILSETQRPSSIWLRTSLKSLTSSPRSIKHSTQALEPIISLINMPPRKSYRLVSSQASLPENGPRRLSRVSSTTSRHPSIVLPPSDSRRSVNRPIPAAPTLTNKRTRSVSVSETEASNQESQSRKKHLKINKRKKTMKRKARKKNPIPPTIAILVRSQICVRTPKLRTTIFVTVKRKLTRSTILLWISLENHSTLTKQR